MSEPRPVQALIAELRQYVTTWVEPRVAETIGNHLDRLVRVAAGAGDRPTLCQHTNWLPPVHAGDPEVCENCGLERGAGDRPPAPSEPSELVASEHVMVTAFEALCDFLDAAHVPLEIAVADVRVIAERILAAAQRGAVRPPPRAALTVETLADWIWDAAARTSGSHVTISRTGCEVLATRLLPRLGAASPAAAPPQEER